MRLNPSRLHGFSLIEILIGMAIAMLTILIMMQAMSVAEGYRRTATTGGDAQSNGAIAMYTMQRDMRLSGYGIVTTETDGALARCANGTTLASHNGTTRTFNSGLPFAPFVINPTGVPAGDPGSDIIAVIYSGSLGMVGNGIPVARIAANAYNATGNRGGFRNGDLILIAGQAGESCSMAEITSLPEDGNCGDNRGANLIDASWIVHDSATTYFNIHANSTCSQQTSPEWNPPAELVTYTLGKAYNLGPAAHTTPPIIASGLVAKLYAVRNGRLTTCDMLANDCTAAANACTRLTPATCNDNVWVPLVDDIVALKALYGMDSGVSGGTANDGIADSWLDSNQIDTVTFTHIPSTFASWEQLLAARIALVSRSTQFEKNAVTTAGIRWNDGNSPVIDLSLTSPAATPTDWQHYRYRSFETKVPFRNMIWKK